MNLYDFKPESYADFRIDYAVVGPIQTNVYFLKNVKTGEVLVVDPGDSANELISYLKRENLMPRAVLLTHGHHDHILAADAIRKAFDIPVCCYEAEETLLMDARLNGSAGFGPVCTLKPDVLFTDGEEKEMAGMRFTVLHTPGHTAGSCCYYFAQYKTLMAGDTLFQASYGRTDLPTGNMRQMIASLRKLLALPDDVVVYPGHGEASFIAFEKKFNPVADYL